MNHSAVPIKRSTWYTSLTSEKGLLIGLFVVGIISRLPFRSHLLYHWDSVNFALGMEWFDVRLHQPHPPGYLLYVLLGRLFNLPVGDANASLVWISIIFGGLTASVAYLLGRRLFGRTQAVIAALFTLTSPAFWFYGEVALTYIVEAFFVTAIALVCLGTLRGNWRLAFPSALLLGLAGGIRQTTLVLMLPLWLFSLRRCPWRISLLALCELAATALAWFVPTVVLSGGLGPYLEASQAIGGGVLSSFELFNGGEAALGPLVRLGMYLTYGLMLGLVPLAYGSLKGIVQVKGSLRRWLSDDRAHVVALWLIPNLVFYAPLVRAPGHTFSFMPALVLLAAAALVMLGRNLAERLSWSPARVTISLTGLTLLVNVVFFLAAPPYLLGIRRVVTTTPSWPTISARDQYLAERVAYIQQHFDAASTVILTSGPDYRHPDYYLRGYDTLNFETESVTSKVPAGRRTLVFFSDDLTSPQDDVQAVSLPSGASLFYLPIYPTDEITIDESKVFVRSYAQ
jgi:hypothetical protein